MPRERISAKVGPLEFHPDFSDPIVDISYEARTATHETINGDNIIQVMGKQPPEISIEGVIYDSQLEHADALIREEQEIPVLSERWTGMAVVETVETPYRREADPETGEWIHDINIDLLAVRDYIGEPEEPDRLTGKSTRGDIHPSDYKLYKAAEEMLEYTGSTSSDEKAENTERDGEITPATRGWTEPKIPEDFGEDSDS